MKNNELLKLVEIEEGSDEDYAQCEFVGTGRLSVETIHGTVIIDIRCGDVNVWAISPYAVNTRDRDVVVLRKP